MIKLYDSGAYLVNGTELVADTSDAVRAIADKTGKTVTCEDAKKETIAYSILKEHNTSDNMDKLKIRNPILRSSCRRRQAFPLQIDE